MLLVWFLVLLNYTHIFPDIISALSTTQNLPQIYNFTVSDAAILGIAMYITNKITSVIMKITLDDRVLL